MVLFPIPNNLHDVQSYLDALQVDGVILSGGNDISGNLYGSEVKNASMSELRDNTEKDMLNYCVANRLPVLGICRGMQFINIYFGGKLIDLDNHPPAVEHSVVANVSGFEQEFMVNSYHNQGITDGELASDLQSFAKHTGVIEGIYHPELPIAGVQWHPERHTQNHDLSDKIISSFVNNKNFWSRQ